MASRLRVLELGKYYHPYRGGMETHLKMLCDGLNAQIDLTVLVSGERPRTSRDLVDGVRVIRAGRLGRFSAAPICPSLPWLVHHDLVGCGKGNPPGRHVPQ